MSKPLLSVTAGFLLLTMVGASGMPAFPGAEGFGSETPGGRGGVVLEVTNLEDRGSGSFRAACEAEGPRTVVFRVGGTIILETPVKIRNPYLSIAGQSAPGGGICLRNSPTNGKTTLTILTHDVVIRFLRIRPGPSAAESDASNALAIQTGASNVLIDHCSMSWAVDQVFSTWRDAHDVTVQWCFITEGLHESVHPQGPHGKGLLIGDRSTRISLHHNLFAHNVDRNPRLKGGLIDLVNNVTYNSVQPPGIFMDDDAALQVNYVGNWFQPGPDTPADQFAATLSEQSGEGLAVYLHENVSPHRPLGTVGKQFHILKPAQRHLAVESPFSTPPVTILSPGEAYTRILREAGATHPSRDAVDTRIVREVESQTGSIIDHPSEVGGWPDLAAGLPPSDQDQDGMPDAWETAQGLDPVAPEDRNHPASSGYTFLEEYLNGLISDRRAVPSSAPSGRRPDPEAPTSSSSFPWAAWRK